jgi:hypothetical protein
MLAAVLLALLTQTPQKASPCQERVPGMLLDRLVALPELASRNDVSFTKLEKTIGEQVAKMCVTPAPIFLHWLEWERVSEPVDDAIPDYPRQKELDAWLDRGVRAVIFVLDDGKPPPETLPGDQLCDRAMQAVAPALRAASEPIDDALNQVWRKKWPVAAVAKFLGDACKAERVHEKSRAALVCYSRCKGSLFTLIDRMDECDEQTELSLDEWMQKMSERLDAAIAKSR